MSARSRAVVVAGLLALAPGCSSAPAPRESTWVAPTGGQANATSGTTTEVFFPMIDGQVFFYATHNEMGEGGMLVARVYRADATHGELRFPSGSKRFEYATDGVVLQGHSGPTYVLKAPITVGTSWRGEHGGTTKIISTTAQVEVPAGTFKDCIQTMEERLGDAPIRYATTFCPTVGVVVIEAATGLSLERAELKSFGGATDIGPDGVTKYKSDAPPP